jgi:hypothetical protein
VHEEVEAILARRYPSFQFPLRRAWAWNREANIESLTKGEELSRALKRRYPHVLQVCYELAFSLVRQKRRDEAISELQVAARSFPILDEDCLSLLARCHKDEGDDRLARGLLAAAQSEYQAAEETYQKAYELRQDRFPGINIAGLRLIRASLLAAIADADPSQAEPRQRRAAALVQQSQEMAQELLARRDSWVSRLADDNIWIAATEAEAHLLLQAWDPAAQTYRLALSQTNRQPFHMETIKSQALRLLAAYLRLQIAPQGSIADAEDFFTSAAPPAK